MQEDDDLVSTLRAALPGDRAREFTEVMLTGVLQALGCQVTIVESD